MAASASKLPDLPAEFRQEDIVDDIARYGRIDLPRRETAFCQRHIAIFDLAFRLLYATDEKVNYSLRRWLGLPGEGPLPVVTR